MFRLKRGHVAQYVDSRDGKELIIHIYGPDSIFPLSWGLNGETPNFGLKALSSCEVQFVSMAELKKFLTDNPKELLDLTKRLLLGLSGMAARVEILSFENAERRILSTLQYLRKHFGKNIQFTHEELAALTGLTRERVSIEMKKMKDSGVLNYRRGKIALK